MEHEKLTVTIGIPAFNEEKNLGNLLRELRQQKIYKGQLVEVIVASDGSVDKTVEVVERAKNAKVRLIKGNKRRGKSYRQNQIINKASSDILVLLDADTLMNDRFFVNKLIRPIVKNEADLTSAALSELAPESYFESALYLSMRFKGILFGQLNNGDNVYNCHGPARAFSKFLYKRIKFTTSEGEDMYSYLFCKFHGFKFKFVEDAKIWYRLPSNLGDHIKQSVRYSFAKDKETEIFDSRFVKGELGIPLSVLFSAGVKSLPLILQNPVKTLLYICIFLYTNFKFHLNYELEDMWQVSSSKDLVRT